MATIVPFTGCSSARLRASVSGNHRAMCTQMSGAKFVSTQSSSPMTIWPTIDMTT